jgi:general L-amino acid transport system substrate-binding protein
LGGGSNGSISVHNSSSMIGLAISSVSVVPMPEVNSSPRKLTAPRGLLKPSLRASPRRPNQRFVKCMFPPGPRRCRTE